MESCSENPIFKRASVRAWTDQPVSREQIINVLKAGMQAPSAMNSQPWEFAVITNPEMKTRLAGISPYSHFAAGAPVLLAVLCRKENSCPPYNEIDMGICIENLLLEITALGLGGVCLGVAPLKDRMKYMAEVLQLDETLESIALVPFGYPKQDVHITERFDPERIRWIE